jgi:hypothetical protein
MYIGLWLLSARHVSTLLHPHCTPGPSPYIYKKDGPGPSYGKVAARENGLTGRLSLSHANACNPLLQAHPYWAQDNTSRGSPYCSPCVPSRADPSGLGHAAIIYSSVQGPPGSKHRQTLTLLSFCLGPQTSRAELGSVRPLHELKNEAWLGSRTGSTRLASRTLINIIAL